MWNNLILSRLQKLLLRTVLVCVLRDHVKYVTPAVKLWYQGRRSGGVIVIVKQTNKLCDEFVEGIDVECDSVLVLKLSGTLLGTQADCPYLSTYVPPSGSCFYD